jgi:hypothetical protein
MIVAHRLTYCAKSSTLCIPLGYIEPVAVKSPSHVFRRLAAADPKNITDFSIFVGAQLAPKIEISKCVMVVTCHP